MPGRKMVGTKNGTTGRPAVKKSVAKRDKSPVGGVAKITPQVVLSENLAKALKSGHYLIVVAHVENGMVWHSQTSAGFPLPDVPKVFDFVTRELTVGSRAA